MHVYLKDGKGEVVPMVVRKEAKELFAKNCFRDPAVHRGDNFTFWRSVEDVFGEVRVVTKLIEELLAKLRTSHLGHHTVEIEFPHSVGWISNHPRALPTKYFTVGYEIKKEHSGALIVLIHRLYPGAAAVELSVAA